MRPETQASETRGAANRAIRAESATGGPDAALPVDEETLYEAEQVLRLLRDLVPTDAVALCAWDATGPVDRHVTLAGDGYPLDVLTHINGEFVATNPAYRMLYRQVPPPMRWREMARDWDIRFTETRTAVEFLRPAGFKEGTTVCLRLPDGRYTGSFHASWETPRAATDRRMTTIEQFRPLLAAACDLLRAPRFVARAVSGDGAAVVMRPDGSIEELQGHPRKAILDPAGRLCRLLQDRSPMRRDQQFLWIDDAGGLHRVRTVYCQRGDIVVTERPIDPPADLTGRELQVLHLMALGESNPQIAQRLVVSPRTISTHVERILGKLTCATRAQAAAYAVSEGLMLAETPTANGTSLIVRHDLTRVGPPN